MVSKRTKTKPVCTEQTCDRLTLCSVASGNDAPRTATSLCHGTSSWGVFLAQLLHRAPARHKDSAAWIRAPIRKRATPATLRQAIAIAASQLLGLGRPRDAYTINLRAHQPLAALGPCGRAPPHASPALKPPATRSGRIGPIAALLGARPAPWSLVLAFSSIRNEASTVHLPLTIRIARVVLKLGAWYLGWGGGARALHGCCGLRGRGGRGGDAVVRLVVAGGG
jgi:hypothetical protein